MELVGQVSCSLLRPICAHCCFCVRVCARGRADLAQLLPLLMLPVLMLLSLSLSLSLPLSALLFQSATNATTSCKITPRPPRADCWRRLVKTRAHGNRQARACRQIATVFRATLFIIILPLLPDERPSGKRAGGRPTSGLISTIAGARNVVVISTPAPVARERAHGQETIRLSHCQLLGIRYSRLRPAIICTRKAAPARPAARQISRQEAPASRPG